MCVTHKNDEQKYLKSVSHGKRIEVAQCVFLNTDYRKQYCWKELHNIVDKYKLYKMKVIKTLQAN